MVVSQPQNRTPPQAVSVLILIENSATIAADWLNLRDHYIRTTIASLKASNATVPMNVMVLPTLPPQSDEQLWPAPQRYGELQNFEFNPHPSNKISAGHIHSGIEFLISCHTGNFSSVARHIFIVAATTPSDNISGIDTAGKPVWSFLAHKLFEANIYCHLIASQTNDVSPLMGLFEETLELQENVEHTFPVLSWFASNAQTYALRLAARPYPQQTQTVQSGGYNSVSQQEASTSAAPEPTPNKPIVFMEPLGTSAEEPPNLVSQIQQLHGLARKKSGVQAPRRTLFRDDPVSPLNSGSTPAENTQGGRAPPSYKLERSSRVGLNPGSISRSRSGSTSQSSRGPHPLASNVTFTPGVTTLLPIPPAPNASSSPSTGTSRQPQADVFNAQTLLPIPPAPNSAPSPPSSVPSRQISFDRLNSIFAVSPSSTSQPSTTLGIPHKLSTESAHSQAFYPAEFTKSSSGNMSAILPVPQPPAPAENEPSSSSPFLQPATVDGAHTPRADSTRQQPSILEEDEAILDALLDPNHHFTLDLFQTNLMQMLNADEAKILLSPRSTSVERVLSGSNPLLVRDQTPGGATASVRTPVLERLATDKASSPKTSSPTMSTASSHLPSPTSPFIPMASPSRSDLLPSNREDFPRQSSGDERSVRFTSPARSIQLTNQPLSPHFTSPPSTPTLSNTGIRAGSPSATRINAEASPGHRIHFLNHPLSILPTMPQLNGSSPDSSSLRGWAG